MNLSNKTIKEIAEYLDCGLVCYLNKDTYEVRSIVDPEDMYAEEEHWKEPLEEIESNWTNYVIIEKMDSSEYYRLMENFIEEVSDEEIKRRLVYALNGRKPFRNFKYEVDYNEEVRQQWFKFKEAEYEKWVRKYVESIKNGKE